MQDGLRLTSFSYLLAFLMQTMHSAIPAAFSVHPNQASW